MIKVCLDAIKKGRASYQIGTKWEADHIRVFYMDGTFDLSRRVAQVARQWADISGVAFVPARNKEESDVRVTFAPGGSWSYVGTQALGIPLKDPTMQLGWLVDNTGDEELQEVVLHEFGHVMGLLHEHQSPAGGIKWDTDRVYAFYMGYPNYWSRSQVDTNLFHKYSAELTQYTAFDPKSIMLYPVPEEFTIDEYSIGWNVAISDMDRDFVRELYAR